MVLVSYRLDNYVSILQTKFSYREGHKARRIGLEAMPLDQHIEDSHGEREARLKIRPAPMHHLFAMADERQHREHRLNEQAILPLAPLTQCEIGGIAFGGMEGGIARQSSALQTAESAPETSCPGHWPWHTPTPRSTPID